MKSLWLVLALAACGGSSKPKPAEPAPAPAPAPEATPAPAPATPPPAETSSVSAQADLAAQYETGKKVYVDKKCATCHGDHGEGNSRNPKLIGDGALPEKAAASAKLRKGVTFHTAADVLGFVKAKMPIKSPGSLSDADAAAVTAWILSEDKVAIDKPLDASNAASFKLR